MFASELVLLSFRDNRNLNCATSVAQNIYCYSICASMRILYSRASLNKQSLIGKKFKALILK